MWKRIRQFFAPPVFPDDEEKTRNARLLNNILLVVMGLVMAFSIPALWMTPAIGRILLEIMLALFALGMLMLMRRGHVNLAAFLLSFILWAAVSYGTYEAGGFRGSTMSAYFGILMIAGMLLGWQGGVLFGAASILVTGWMLYADTTGQMPPAAVYATLGTFYYEFAAVVVGVTALMAMTINSLQQAIQRARRGERELAIKVRETEDLAHQAQAASQFKSNLIARVSHELRTPLGAMMGITEMLHYEIYGKLDGGQKDLTRRLLENTHYLERLINELLDQSQIQAGRLVMHVVEFSLQEIIHKLEAIYRPQAETKKLELIIDISENLPRRLKGDPGRIEQILLNLVENAIKFTHQGKIEVKFIRFDETYWAMQVADTGIGIPEAEQQTIFEPFRQMDESSVRQYGGVGLGLSIVRQLTEAMQGHIHVASEPNQGSIFTVTLPLELSTDQTETRIAIAQGD